MKVPVMPRNLGITARRPLLALLAATLVGSAAAGCGGGGGGSGTGDTLPGVVLVNFEQAGEDNVPLNRVLRFVFSAPLDPASIGPASIQIRQGPTFGASVFGKYIVEPVYGKEQLVVGLYRHWRCSKSKGFCSLAAAGRRSTRTRKVAASPMSRGSTTRCSFPRRAMRAPTGRSTTSSGRASPSRGLRPKVSLRAQNPATAGPNSRRITVRPWDGRYSPEWGLIKGRIIVAGCSE